VYETCQWTYRTETFQINYRVEDQDQELEPMSITFDFPPLVQAGQRASIDLLGFGASDKPSQAASLGFS
jgi:hypothetical protein